MSGCFHHVDAVVSIAVRAKRRSDSRPSLGAKRSRVGKGTQFSKEGAHGKQLAERIAYEKVLNNGPSQFVHIVAQQPRQSPP